MKFYSSFTSLVSISFAKGMLSEEAYDCGGQKVSMSSETSCPLMSPFSIPSYHNLAQMFVVVK